MRLNDWNDAPTAALFLRPCTRKHLNEKLGPLLTRKTGNRFGSGHARSGGWHYSRHDLERVRAIMDTLGLNALAAAQMLHSVRTLEGRKLVPYLVELLVREQQEEARP